MKFYYPYFGLLVLGSSFLIPQAHAAWLDNNLRDGLQFSIGATISPTLTQRSSKFTYLYGDPSIYGPNGSLEQVLKDQDKRETDERMRLDGQESVMAYISAQQMLTRDIRIFGSVGLWATPNTASRRGYSFGATINHNKIGSLGINTSSAFSTSRIATSRTYTALDTAGSAVSASYTAIPNLTVSAYHAFPESGDTRSEYDVGLHSGYGVAASYNFDFAPRHQLTIGAGHTKGERHVEVIGDRATDPWGRVTSTAKEKEATALGFSYQLNDWKLSVDGGKAEEYFNGHFYNRTKTDNYGVRIDYEVTPRISTYASYGKRKSKKTPTEGNQLSYENLINNNLGVNESLVFDQVKQDRYTLGAEYDLYHNITLQGSVSGTKTKNYVTEGAFSKRETLNYQAGVSFNF